MSQKARYLRDTSRVGLKMGRALAMLCLQRGEGGWPGWHVPSRGNGHCDYEHEDGIATCRHLPSASGETKRGAKQMQSMSSDDWRAGRHMLLSHSSILFPDCFLAVTCRTRAHLAFERREKAWEKEGKSERGSERTNRRRPPFPTAFAACCYCCTTHHHHAQLATTPHTSAQHSISHPSPMSNLKPAQP